MLTGAGGSCASPSVALSYDPFLRLYQVAGSATSRFAYDGLDIIADYNQNNAMQHRYVFGPGIDAPIVEYAGSGTSNRTFLTADERGSIIARSGNTGALSAANSYDEYGTPGSGNAGLFQYTGQAWIAQLGMQYSKARFYSPTLGRFMQTDPTGTDGGVNVYASTQDDPANYTDPSGIRRATERAIDKVTQIIEFNTNPLARERGSSPGTNSRRGLLHAGLAATGASAAKLNRRARCSPGRWRGRFP